MLNKKSVWAIIPARSGSQSVKNNNIIKINNMPLIAYTIRVAKKTKGIQKVVVTSDSEKYLNIAKKYGADILHLRSKKNSSNIASDFDFIVRLFQKDGLKFMYCNDTFIRMIDGGLSHKLSSKIKLQMELLKICKNRGIKTNHFFLLCRFLIKFPGLLQKLQVLRSIFNT